jgi:hypothetical protein
LLTKEHFQQLLKNGMASVPEEKDHKPVVFLFSSHGLATLLVSELLPEDEDIAFCLIDRSDGAVVSGYIALSYLEGMRDISMVWESSETKPSLQITRCQSILAFVKAAKSDYVIA